MKILKRYVGEEDWFEVEEDEVVKRAEGGGFFEENTSIKTLKDSGYIRTSFSEFKILNKGECCE
jgi:hypothetical protein